jgi:hypothetical protein
VKEHTVREQVRLHFDSSWRHWFSHDEAAWIKVMEAWVVTAKTPTTMAICEMRRILSSPEGRTCERGHHDCA